MNILELSLKWTLTWLFVFRLHLVSGLHYITILYGSWWNIIQQLHSLGMCKAYAFMHTTLNYKHGCLTSSWEYITSQCYCLISLPDDVIKWKHIPRYWPFVREIHWSPVNFPHKGQWRGALMFSLICTRIKGWVNNHEAGDLRRNRAHHDVIVMRQK